MSRVIAQAKDQYKQAILIEWLILCFCFLLITSLNVIQSDKTELGELTFAHFKGAVDFSLGFLSGFLPFCLFTLMIFFRHQAVSQKLTVFYRAEAVKFGLTIVLIILAFKVFLVSKLMWFFLGFFVALVSNNLIPFWLRKK